MRFLAAMLCVLAVSCCHIPTGKTAEGLILDSTVRIVQTVSGNLMVGDVELEDAPLTYRSSGSGTVYAKENGSSKIVTANHVLEQPVVGSVVEMEDGVFVKITSVTYQVLTHDNQRCEFDPLMLSADTADSLPLEDVATGIAYCDAGRVAPIYTGPLLDGAEIRLAGHPEGVPVAIVSQGYYSGNLEGYLVASGACKAGCSGGGMWFNGQLVGVIVRALADFPNYTLSIGADTMTRRIAETP